MSQDKSIEKTYLIASQIKVILEEKGFTQNDVARLEGCSRQLVSQVINGVDRSKRITKRISKLIDRPNLVILDAETQAELVKEYGGKSFLLNVTSKSTSPSTAAARMGTSFLCAISLTWVRTRSFGLIIS